MTVQIHIELRNMSYDEYIEQLGGAFDSPTQGTINTIDDFLITEI